MLLAIETSWQTLCSAKPQAQFTTHAVATCAASLSPFTPEIANRALLETAFCADPFPDIGKIVIRAENIRKSYAGAPSVKTLSEPTLQAISEALGVSIGDPKPTTQSLNPPLRDGSETRAQRRADLRASVQEQQEKLRDGNVHSASFPN